MGKGDVLGVTSLVEGERDPQIQGGTAIAVTDDVTVAILKPDALAILATTAPHVARKFLCEMVLGYMRCWVLENRTEDGVGVAVMEVINASCLAPALPADNADMDRAEFLLATRLEQGAHAKPHPKRL
jgi:hypothetical protein